MQNIINAAVRCRIKINPINLLELNYGELTKSLPNFSHSSINLFYANHGITFRHSVSVDFWDIQMARVIRNEKVSTGRKIIMRTRKGNKIKWISAFMCYVFLLLLRIGENPFCCILFISA